MMRKGGELRIERSFPELALCPTPPDREEAERIIRHKLSSEGFWIGLSMVNVGAAVLLSANGILTISSLWWMASIAVTANLLAFAIRAVGIATFVKPDVHSLLRRRLNQLGVRICLNCGYDLRAQTEHRCPECGHATEETSE